MAVTERKRAAGHPTSVRISDEADRIWTELSEKTGLKRVQVLELALRQMASTWQVGPDSQPQQLTKRSRERVAESIRRLGEIGKKLTHITPDMLTREAMYQDHD